MSRRAIRENIQLERWQYWPECSKGQYRSLRAEYFPVLPDCSEYNNMTFTSDKKNTIIKQLKCFHCYFFQ